MVTITTMISISSLVSFEHIAVRVIVLAFMFVM